MQRSQQWIWQHGNWPHFYYDAKQLLPDIAVLSRLIGEIEMTCRTLAGDVLLDARSRILTDDALGTSAIEGEALRRSSVQASVRKRLGLPVMHDDSDSRTDNLVAMLMDARKNVGKPLLKETLFSWQTALFPTGYSGLHKIHTGRYRGKEQMQIVSGPVAKEKIHYVAPPGNMVDHEMNLFLSRVNADDKSDPILKAGTAHLWFIMIHPFDDGNGRIGRAITDYLLSGNFPLMMQIISFSKHISLDQKGYYHILEQAGKGGLDITDWLVWFLRTLTTAMHESRWIIAQVVQKASFWHEHKDTVLNDRQRKVLNRLLDAGDRFEGCMMTRKYAGMTKCSKVTAGRDLADLEIKCVLKKCPGGGRSTSYVLNLEPSVIFPVYPDQIL